MIRTIIAGRNRAEANGISVVAAAPVLALCRKLIAAGVDPAEPLEAYRGDVLCLRVRSIGEGARLEVQETVGAPRFARYRERPNNRRKTGGHPNGDGSTG